MTNKITRRSRGNSGIPCLTGRAGLQYALLRPSGQGWPLDETGKMPVLRRCHALPV